MPQPADLAKSQVTDLHRVLKRYTPEHCVQALIANHQVVALAEYPLLAFKDAVQFRTFFDLAAHLGIEHHQLQRGEEVETIGYLRGGPDQAGKRRPVQEPLQIIAIRPCQVEEFVQHGIEPIGVMREGLAEQAQSNPLTRLGCRQAAGDRAT